VAQTAIRWGCSVVIAYFGYLSIVEMAGLDTKANIAIKLLGDLSVSNAVAWLFGGGGIAYGVKQRQLRQTTVERMHRRQVELEKEHDSRRTSSRLTSRGRTNPEDKQ
jgi:hypothetical protein